MANRDNHYEAAFEEYLRFQAVPYVAVDEARRSLLAEGGSLKSLDYIVSPPTDVSYLVDVKGRRFPSGEQKQYWKNWSTREDVLSLARWEAMFGSRFTGLFVFAYNIVGDRAPLSADRLFEYRGGLYAFLGVALADYAAHARQISPRWDTLAMSATEFRRHAVPLDELFRVGAASE